MNLRKSSCLLSCFPVEVFFHKVQLIAHPAFVRLHCICSEQSVKYPQVFGAVLLQTMSATGTERLCRDAGAGAPLLVERTRTRLTRAARGGGEPGGPRTGPSPL